MAENRLPESVEREIADGCTQDGAHDPPPCPRCQRMRRAVAAALLRAEAGGLTNLLLTRPDSERIAVANTLRAQAAALEARHDR